MYLLLGGMLHSNCLAKKKMKMLTNFVEDAFSISPLGSVFVVLVFFFMCLVCFFSAQVNSWKKRVLNLTRELEDVKTDLNQ